jgi:type VI protein secretion system component VasF
MKVVKRKYSKRQREREAREQMRQAIMELVREAQGDRYEEPDNSFIGRSARFIGSAASRIHRIFSSVWVLVPLALALLYLLMHFSGISVQIAKGGNTLMTIR